MNLKSKHPLKILTTLPVNHMKRWKQDQLIEIPYLHLKVSVHNQHLLFSQIFIFFLNLLLKEDQAVYLEEKTIDEKNQEALPVY